VVSVSLLDTTTLAASGSESAHLPVLHHWVADPVDARVVADDAVIGVNQDDLKELVHSVKTNPVAVENPQAAAAASNPLLGEVAKVPGGLDPVDGTRSAGLSVDDTLVDRSLAGATADTNPVDHVALLGLVSQPAGLVGPAGLGDPGDGRSLAVFPNPDTSEEAKHIRLLLLPELFHILVGAHPAGPVPTPRC